MNKRIVWTIAGSDCSGGAGIQADLHSFHALGVHGCSVIAALTAQNSVALEKIEFCAPPMLLAQLESLSTDLPPQAIKLGMIGALETLKTISPFLERFPNHVVYDPVLFASVGGALYQGEVRDYLIQHFLAKVSVLTPNLPEAEWLLGYAINTQQDMEAAATALQALGPKVVLLKGGHCSNQGNLAQDYWTDGISGGWLSSPRINTENRHGTGCTLSAAIAAFLAQGYEVKESLVLAKAYVNQAIRLSTALGQGRGMVTHHGWPCKQDDFPLATLKAKTSTQQKAFLSCGPEPLGFYPVVDSALWVRKMLESGVKTIQLRIKNAPTEQLIREIKESIKLSQEHQARLFINDYWRYAIEYGAYGVHLGQEDLEDADCALLQKVGIRLGVSTHSYYEIARALSYKPSYIACGAIYHTDTKMMSTAPQGLDRLKAYCQMLNYPVVAIGGIKLDKIDTICQAGAESIAVVTAITKAADPQAEARLWLKHLAFHQKEPVLNH